MNARADSNPITNPPGAALPGATWLLTGDEPDKLVRARDRHEIAALEAIRAMPHQNREIALAALRGMSAETAPPVPDGPLMLACEAFWAAATVCDTEKNIPDERADEIADAYYAAVRNVTSYDPVTPAGFKAFAQVALQAFSDEVQPYLCEPVDLRATACQRIALKVLRAAARRELPSITKM